MWNLLRVVLLHLLCFQRVVGSNDELHLVSGGKKSSYSVSSRLKDFTNDDVLGVRDMLCLYMFSYRDQFHHGFHVFSVPPPILVLYCNYTFI